MAEKELSILVRAKGAQQAAGQISKVDRAVGGLVATGRKTAANLTTAFTRIGLAVGVGVAGAVGMGIRSLTDLSRTTEQTNAVIESTGGKAGVTADEVRALSQSLENLTTVDDKVIQDGQNMLLTFTGISGEVFPRATKATLNLAVAMAKGDASQVDMKASAIQVGKALNDPIKGVTALRKVGVAFTEQQVKQIKALVKSGKTVEAQTIILKELETEFGKAGEAAGKGPAATWRRLQDVGEDLSQALARGLLPVLERAGNWLSTKLADPAVIAAIEDLGEGLADAASKALDFIETIDFKAIADGLRTAAGFAGGVVQAFMDMPDWVKTAVITGWGLNKLTGGAVTGLIGSLASGLIKGILNMNAGVVNVNAGVVNGAPGIGGKGGIPPVAGVGAGFLGMGAAPFAALVAGTLAPIVATLAVSKLTDPTGARNDQGRVDTARARGIPESNIRRGAANPNGAEQIGTAAADAFRSRINASTGFRMNQADPKVVSELAAIKRFEESQAPSQESMKAHLANLETLQRSQAPRDASYTAQIVAAIQRLERIIGQPVPVRVTVSASDVTASTNDRGRIVKPHGPRHAIGTGPLR